MNAADDGEMADSAGKRGSRQSGMGPGGQAAAFQHEQLDYIADMVQALKAMAAQADCRTLSNILDLAHREALQRRRAGKTG